MSGSLFAAHTGHHHTKVVLMLTGLAMDDPLQASTSSPERGRGTSRALVAGDVWLVRTLGTWSDGPRDGYYRVVVSRATGGHSVDTVDVQILETRGDDPLATLRTVRLTSPGFRGFVEDVTITPISNRQRRGAFVPGALHPGPGWRLEDPPILDANLIRKLLVSCLVVAVCGGLLWLPAAEACWGKYRGTVVREDGGEPIAGAVVVVEWAKSFPILDAPRHLHKIVETVTDAEGRFEITACSGINFNPFLWIVRHQMVVYKAGFVPWPRYYFSPTWQPEMSEILSEAEATGITIRLREVRTKTDRFNSASISALSLAVEPPFQQIPKLIDQLNAQSTALGLPPYPQP